MRLDTFFATHPIFTTAEVQDHVTSSGGSSDWLAGLLQYHRRKGHVIKIRRGLYAVAPTGADPATYPVDPFLVASRLAPDGVLSYHTALAFHGMAQSVREEFWITTCQPHVRPLDFRGMRFRATAPPARLEDVGFGVQDGERRGQDVRVTSVERTLVDVAARPGPGGGWEEVTHAWDDAAVVDIDVVVAYALLLSNATTIGKIGYLLERERDRWGVSQGDLAPLRERRPGSPVYVDRTAPRGHLAAEWNLIVPATGGDLEPSAAAFPYSGGEI